MPDFSIAVTPADDLIDVPRRIVVRGAAPGETVRVSTATVRNGAGWASSARFIADAQGEVDLAMSPALDGDYRGIDTMGLLWSQQPLQAGKRDNFHADVMAPLVTVVTACGVQGTASAELVQRLASAGVTRREVREQGLVGTLFLPATPGPHPAVMIVNGSGGGINEPRAALYASRGYAAFALAYFKAPGLSDYISNTPLEYFEHGLDWLRAEVRPQDDFVAISGQSRGGELVLLLGATFPQKVSAVLAYVPSALVHSGQNAADPAVGREGPTWLLRGQPLPHQWEGNRSASWKPFDEGPSPHRHELAMLTALQDEEAVARARIPVERIQGAVLLLSATDDGSWPSSVYCRMVSDKLAEAQHAWPVVWRDYANAGHSILFPFVPTTQTTYAHPVSGRISTGGGEPSANARADLDSWQHAQQFLRDAVSQHKLRKETP
ncbi:MULTISPECIES: acyl-CoA thioester hydrolase/BAAT C-terminal domain-containing protein [unclassified Herbaspirillum]|uniref:acyl-CoA thioester hydrolase/BAAT C-terminal domain-containing protein n=1 Tax=unclassified Herbaspirillum TaxID=2624150 RepID=UPI00115083D4|nr:MULTISPECIES: acyl-CoA thioesterase/bile acid-CoA:amino acid N-acyltransferase family protein [unclassified Herbaspirillum]MBB5391009.1 dienelactone hydrolase [Herbaspirillum sp. SJZ102]TQK13291.1 dienelactone hydrolase [Herbaspirillum sp. SJZ130]TQK15295.1 dienelactone hydrolase [Herbaspirillum sp. SJZ106]TWC62604.1 dienelactone hydrolase [Herbaspirillum sp. SJZ099]